MTTQLTMEYKAQPITSVYRSDFGVDGGFIQRNQYEAIRDVTVKSNLSLVPSIVSQMVLDRGLGSTLPMMEGNYRTSIQRRRLYVDAKEAKQRINWSKRDIKVQSYIEAFGCSRDFSDDIFPQIFEMGINSCKQAIEYNLGANILVDALPGEMNEVEAIVPLLLTANRVFTTITPGKITLTDLAHMISGQPDSVTSDPNTYLLINVRILDAIFMAENDFGDYKNDPRFSYNDATGLMSIKTSRGIIKIIAIDTEDSILGGGGDITSGVALFPSNTVVGVFGVLTDYTIARSSKVYVSENTLYQQMQGDAREMLYEVSLGGRLSTTNRLTALKIK